MTESSHSMGFSPNNNEIDQKNKNQAIDGPDLDEFKLMVSKDDSSNDTLQMHSSVQHQTNGLTNSQSALNSTLINSNTQTTLCNSLTTDNLATDEAPQPPAYWQVPGTVPLNAGSAHGPPPTYDEVINPNCVEPPSYHSLFGQVQAARKNAKTLPDLIRKLIIILLGTIGLAILISFTILIPFTMILVGGSHLDDCPAEKIPLFLLIGGITWLTKNLSNFFTQCSTRRSDRTTNSASQNNSNNSTSNSSTNPCASRFSANTCSAESNTCASGSTNCGNANSANRSRCVINLDTEQSAELQIKSRRRDFLINCFITAWFLTGCIMVYRIYPPDHSNPSSPNYCNRTVYIYAFWLLTSTFILFAMFITCICCVSLTAIFQSNSEIRI